MFSEYLSQSLLNLFIESWINTGLKSILISFIAESNETLALPESYAVMSVNTHEADLIKHFWFIDVLLQDFVHFAIDHASNIDTIHLMVCLCSY